MTREESADALRSAASVIQNYCNKQEECNGKCILYERGCILYDTPNDWNLYKITGEKPNKGMY